MRLPAMLAAVVLLSSADAQATDLAAHRALYQLKLASNRGDVSSASGTMGYEVIDACDGWAVRQRLQMTITNREGQDLEMVSDYTTWESKDGLSLRFRVRQTTDQAVTSQTEGDASLAATGGAGEARYTVPKEQVLPLPTGTLFPMAHTVAVIDAAREGKKFLTLPLFDGTTAEGAQDSSIAVLGWSKPEKSEFPDLSSLPSTRVHIAFFDRDAGTQTPDYEVGMRYWENGVGDDLNMDFGDFVMDGKMTEFELLPHRC